MTTTQTVDLRPQTVNVLVRRGDAWSFLVTITGLDLTSATIEAQLRPSADAEDSVDLDITPEDLTEGKFHVGQDEATEGGHYDVQVTPAAGLPRTYLAGRLTVDKDVTRP